MMTCDKRSFSRFSADRKRLLAAFAALILLPLTHGGAAAQSSVPVPVAASGAPAASKAPVDPAAVLDGLYRRLGEARDAAGAQVAAAAIAREWGRSGSATASLLLGRSQVALGHDDAPLAIELLDRVIAVQPEWTEARLRRGIVLAATGDDERALSDIQAVLASDPRHYMAMEIVAGIFERRGYAEGALRMYEKALTVHPYLPGANEAIKRLRIAAEGQPA